MGVPVFDCRNSWPVFNDLASLLDYLDQSSTVLVGVVRVRIESQRCNVLLVGSGMQDADRQDLRNCLIRSSAYVKDAWCREPRFFTTYLADSGAQGGID